MANDYLRDPEAIYRRSFEIIRSETRLDHLPRDFVDVAIRLVHACGMTDIVADLAFTPRLAGVARAALEAGAPILCDATMVAAGVARSRLPAGNLVICGLDDPGLSALARRHGTTRSAAAVDLWDELSGGRLAQSVVAIGNAPTALLRLLDLIEAGGPRPAAVLAFPVGFVGAVEAKEALIARPHGLEYLTLRGRRGGSALAAAAVNALLSPGEVCDP